MAITTVGDMFAKAQHFEEDLEKFYADIRDNSQDNGVRLLTYYLSRHRRHFDEVTKAYSADFLQHIKGIELKHDIPFHPEKNFSALSASPIRITGQELIEAAIEYDTALAQLYKSILEQPIIQEAQEVFANLLHTEERDIVMLKKMLAMNYF